jgi:hypothetical protein
MWNSHARLANLYQPCRLDPRRGRHRTSARRPVSFQCILAFTRHPTALRTSAGEVERLEFFLLVLAVPVFAVGLGLGDDVTGLLASGASLRTRRGLLIRIQKPVSGVGSGTWTPQFLFPHDNNNNNTRHTHTHTHTGFSYGRSGTHVRRRCPCVRRGIGRCRPKHLHAHRN